MTDPIPLYPAPFIVWRLTDEEDGTMRIEAINRSGWAEQEIWCSITDARLLADAIHGQFPSDRGQASAPDQS
ncbi:hypothetical protein [Microbacterium sp.]|uniref:hypothetical protein n=1 Tax=Microbacterium sp. TaxID=51671 RepID=UPI003F6F3257